MLDQLNAIFDQFKTSLPTCKTEADLLNLKSDFLGKKGKISQVMGSLKSATVEEKKSIGPKANEIKQSIQQAIQDTLESFELAVINAKLAEQKVDLALTDEYLPKQKKSGGLHPRTLIQREVEDVFLSMGFDILDGPHVEDEFHNFEALNIPKDHPARDMQDTFWFHDPRGDDEKKYLLRTHTSNIQVRGMMARKPPFRFIAPGTVFRCERTDASHDVVFNQLEGMMVGENLSVGNLIYFMKTLLKEIFKKDTEVRLRPGFFPFVEPGFELDISCLICQGKGCSVCKQTGWVELLPCGMIHPNVLKAGNIDPEKYNGFAFGLGFDRLVMMKYGIDDIRHLTSGDLRFNEQFKSY
jgi:phenylalanyl-tRNA synthetase alpha chain